MPKNMRIDDVMTVGCESIGEHDSILEAARKMKRLDIGALAICGDNDELEGIVTDRDIVTEIVGEGLDPARTEASKLKRPTVCCHQDDDLDRAIEIMSIQQVRRLPVVDGNGKLVGLISQSDVAMNAGTRQSGEMLASISEP